MHSVCNDVFCQDVQRLLCCVDECPAATERRRCCGGSLLNRGLKTVSNFVTWWRCGGALQHHHNIITLPGSPHRCTTTAVCRPTCPRLQHLTALHCLDQELSIQGTLACCLHLSLCFLPVISLHIISIFLLVSMLICPGIDTTLLVTNTGHWGGPCQCLHQGGDW